MKSDQLIGKSATSRWTQVAFVLAITAFIAIGWTAYRSILDYLATSAGIERSNDVHDRIEDLVSSVKDMQRGVRGYVITKSVDFLEPFQKGREYTVRRLEALQMTTQARGGQGNRMHLISAFTDELMDMELREVEFVRSGHADSAEAMVTSGRPAMTLDAIVQACEDMKRDETKSLQAREEEAVAELKRILAILTGCAVCTLSLIIGIFVTIERQSQARQALAARLAQSEQRLQTVINSVNEGITFSNAAGGFEVFNQRMRELTGYTMEEANRAGDFSRLLYPNYEDHQKALDGVKEVMETPGNHTFETAITTKSGVKRLLRISSQMLRRERKMFLSTYEDVTDRRAMEQALHESLEKFRMVFEHATEGISIYEETFDPSERRLLECNARFAEMAGRSREELLQRGKTVDLVRPLGEFAVAETEDGTIKRGSFSWIRPDGKENVIEFTATTIPLEGTRLTIAIARDVTESRRAEAEKEELIASLQQALADVKTLSGLVPICSHCKRIRDDKGYWTQVEAYIQARTPAHFSHGICPECLERHYPELHSSESQQA